jgi:hypothetical protein
MCPFRTQGGGVVFLIMYQFMYASKKRGRVVA